MRDFALRLERTYVYRRPIHQLKRLHNSIASCRGQCPGLRIIIHPRDQTIPFKHEATKHFVPGFILALGARLALSTGYLLAVLLSTFRPMDCYFLRHCLDVPIVEGTPG